MAFGDQPGETLVAVCPFVPERAALERCLPGGAAGPWGAALERLLAGAREVARPRAAALLAGVEARGAELVAVGGVELRGPLPAANLQPLSRAFPFLATGGRELAAWAAAQTGELERILADFLQQQALAAASRALDARLAAEYGERRLSVMNPGALPGWPLAEQRPLFALLGRAAAALGVALGENLVMEPLKSLSGIRFAAAEDFQNCRLCPRERCPDRRSAYARAPRGPGRGNGPPPPAEARTAGPERR